MLTEQEEKQRMQLWKQGYTDTQIARMLHRSHASIAAWRRIRGLGKNVEGNCNSCLTDLGELEVGDRVRVGICVMKQRGGTRVKWHNGIVYEVYPKFVVLQLEKYRITVNPWEAKMGIIKIRSEAVQQVRKVS